MIPSVTVHPVVILSGEGVTKASGVDATPLPEPEPLTLGGVDDALTALYAVMSQQRQSALALGKSRVDDAGHRAHEALVDQEQALARKEANEASHGGGFFDSLAHAMTDGLSDVLQGRFDRVVGDEGNDVTSAVNSPAFWSDLEKGALWVAKVAAVVGSVALTVASGGAGAATLALAAMLLSVGGEVVSDTGCLGKDSRGIGLGMELGGAALGAGGALAATSGTAANETLRAVGMSAEVVGGTATMTAGGAHVMNARFAAAAQEADADMVQAKNESQQMESLVSWVIDDMKAEDKARQRGLGEVQGAMAARDEEKAATVMPSLTVKG